MRARVGSVYADLLRRERRHRGWSLGAKNEWMMDQDLRMIEDSVKRGSLSKEYRMLVDRSGPLHCSRISAQERVAL